MTLTIRPTADDMLACIQSITPEMAERGLQFIRIDANTGNALFGDLADPCPIVVEYRVVGEPGWTHSFRITVRGLVMGITMATPWVQWGKETFDPRLKRMRHYADAIRRGVSNLEPQ